MRALAAGLLAITMLSSCSQTTSEASDSDPDLTVPSSSIGTPATGETSPAPTENTVPLATVPGNVTPSGSDNPPIFPSGGSDPGLAPFVEMAVADLSRRLTVAESEIEVVSATLVVWPNTGLGCEIAGMQYAQVPQDGSLIELRVGGKLFHYHSGGSKLPFLCENVVIKPPPTGDVVPDVPDPGDEEGI